LKTGKLYRYNARRHDSGADDYLGEQKMQKKIKVLFVCMGNICRSPTAEGVFVQLAEKSGLRAYLDIDSAGTHSYHVGEAPDARAQTAARQRGVELGHLQARKVRPQDFAEFDYILAMDENNYGNLIAQSPPQYHAKIHRYLDFAPALKASGIHDVPDPYYGGQQGFEQVLDLVEAAGAGLLEQVRQDLARKEKAQKL
jgi:protein-tyrosine phosphatase